MIIKEKFLESSRLKKDGKEVKLGPAFLEEDRDFCEADFKAQIPIVQDALMEFLNGCAKDDWKPEKDGGSKAFVVDFDKILKEILAGLEGNEKDVTLALAIIEAGQLETNTEKSVLEKKVDETDGVEEIELIRDRNESAIAREGRYGESEDFLFNHFSKTNKFPTKKDLLKWLASEKSDLSDAFKDAKERDSDEKWMKNLESRVRSEVPVIDRFLNGKAVVDDYDMISGMVERNLEQSRTSVFYSLRTFFSGKDNNMMLEEIKKDLQFIYILRSFLSLLEGERNEFKALGRRT